MCMKVYICIPIFERHGFPEAKKPTIVAKAVHESVLLSSSLAPKERMPVCTKVSLGECTLYIYIYISLYRSVYTHLSCEIIA